MAVRDPLYQTVYRSEHELAHQMHWIVRLHDVRMFEMSNINKEVNSASDQFVTKEKA